MVELEDGSKMYVSPEEKAQLLLEGKIKKEKAKLFEKPKLNLNFLESDSDEGYETPLNLLPKSCENLGTCVRPEIKRNSSFPEIFSGENGRINLPPFIMPVETSFTYPMTKKKRKEKRKSMANADENEIVPCIEPENDADAPEIRTRESEDDRLKKRFSLRPLSFWPKSKKPEKEVSKTRFSMPWGRPKEESPPENKKEKKSFSVKLPKFSWGRGKKEDLGVDEPDVTNDFDRELEYNDEPFKRRDVFKDKDVNDNDEVSILVEEPKEIFPDNTLQREYPRLASDAMYPYGRKGSESEDLDNMSDGRPETPKWSTFPVAPEPLKEEEHSGEDSEAEEKVSEPPKWSTFRRITEPLAKESHSGEDSEVEEKVSEPPKWSTFPVSPEKKEEGSGEDSETEEKIPEPPKWSTFPLAMGIKTIDRNPLADYFKNKELASEEDEPIRISIVDDRTKTPRKADEQVNPYDRNFDSGSLESIGSKSRVEDETHPEDSSSNSVDKTNEYLMGEKTKHGGSGEVDRLDTESSGPGSDTESADHGSADKSSVSKLTSEKQPKKLMGNLFGSFKIGKSKDKVADNDPTKNPSPFEITIKEQPDEVQIEVPRSERIVYAELDMARSPGNIMRRDDEKTEYAEIIYPGSKTAAERAMEELRRSRENIVSSRENLTEVDEAYTPVTTADGKKEAAV